jgi:hypothetical protein
MAASEPKKLKGISSQPNTVEEWVKARKRYPDLFTYTPEGDLRCAPVRPGDKEKIITLQRYSRATTQQIMDVFDEKETRLIGAQEAYAAAKKKLQDVYAQYKADPENVPEYDVLLANQELHDAECVLNSIAKGERMIVVYETTDGVPQKALNFNHYDDRKFAMNVTQTTYSLFPEEAFWTETRIDRNVGEAGVASVGEGDREVAEEKQTATKTAVQRAIIAAKMRSKAKTMSAM